MVRDPWGVSEGVRVLWLGGGERGRNGEPGTGVQYFVDSWLVLVYCMTSNYYLLWVDHEITIKTKYTDYQKSVKLHNII